MQKQNTCIICTPSLDGEKVSWFCQKEGLIQALLEAVRKKLWKI